MAGRDRLSNFIDQRGLTATILRNSGNLIEKYAVARLNPNVKGGAGMNLDSYQEGFCRWDSQICEGDIFKDGLNEEYHLVLSVQKVGVDGQHDGIKISSTRCNDQMLLYQIIKTQSTPDGEYGHFAYNLSVKLNDYCHVAHGVRGDSLMPIGDLTTGNIFIIFSGRNLATYIPAPGDRCVLGNGTGVAYQIDEIDVHIFPGCYRALCTPDKRM